MTKKQVWRYYCEHCGKAGLRMPPIVKHEAACTLNPKRVCGVCRMMEVIQPSMESLFAALPTRPVYAEPDEDGAGFSHPFTVEELKRLRDAAGNCPACIMAAMRQRKLPVPLLHDAGFDFKKEMDAIWKEFWSEKIQEEIEKDSDYAAHVAW